MGVWPEGSKSSAPSPLSFPLPAFLSHYERLVCARQRVQRDEERPVITPKGFKYEIFKNELE